MSGEPLARPGDLLIEYDVGKYVFFWAVVPFIVVAGVVAFAVVLATKIGSIGPVLPMLFLPVVVVVLARRSWDTEAYWLALSSDGQLLWKTIRRAGRIPLGSVRSIHSVYPPWLNYVRVEAVGEDGVIQMQVLRGFREFANALQAGNPDMHVRLDWGARVAQRGLLRARVRRWGESEGHRPQ